MKGIREKVVGVKRITKFMSLQIYYCQTVFDKNFRSECKGVISYSNQHISKLFFAVSAEGVFSLIYPLSLWNTVYYRLKNCLKGQLNLRQPTKVSNLKLPGGFL